MGERILVGVDRSAGSHAALRWAIDEARHRGATVVALHAWREPLPVSGFVVPTPQPKLEGLEAAATRELDRAVSEVMHEAHGVEIEKLLLRAEPGGALVANAADADLLVVGSRGRGAFMGSLLGSVSQHCAHHARTPVVIVPTPPEMEE